MSDLKEIQARSLEMAEYLSPFVKNRWLALLFVWRRSYWNFTK